MGYFGWSDNDKRVGDVLLGNPATGYRGVSAHTLRGAFFDDFIQQYGKNIRAAEYSYYQSLGAIDLVVFLNNFYHVGAGCADANGVPDGLGADGWDAAHNTILCNPPRTLIDRRDPNAYGCGSLSRRDIKGLGPHLSA